MSRLSASGPHRSSLWRRLRPRDNAATLLRGARACLALLAAAALLALAAPAPAQAQTEVWTATLTPRDLSSGILGCSNGVDTARCSSTSVLSEDSFNYDSTDYNITELFVRSNGQLEFIVDADLTTTTVADLTLVVGSTSLVLSGGTASGTVKLIFSSSGVSLTAGTDITVKLTAPGTPNTAATGAPTISGTLHVGRTQTASPGTIADDDGLTNASYNYQWILVDGTDEEDISGATGATYILNAAAVGKKIKVRASFTDDAGNAESRTSAATATVTADTTATCAGQCLVSNVGQTDDLPVSLVHYDSAQSFKTGDNATGYTLTSIELNLYSGTSTATPTVKLFSGSANGTEESTFTGPAMLDTNTNTNTTKNYTFTPSSTVTLLGSTTYWVVTEGIASWATTASTSEDATSALGWLIADGHETRPASSTGAFSAATGTPFQIRVNGTTVPNTPPTAADNAVTAGVDTAYTFEADDFGFADTDPGDMLASVRIVTVPTPGTLALDGTAVLADAVVTKAQIDGGMLTFTPVAGASGIGYASFTFKVNDGTDDSADAYTMTIDVAELPAITIAADRPTATGKMDWIHYTLSREGDPAAELTVTVTFAGPADNDWGLDPTGSAKREVTFAADSATAEQSILLSGGFGHIGFSESATMSGTLTARLGAKTGYDTSDTDEVAVAVTSGPAWVIKLAEDAYSFDEDGGAQDIELVATAASADMPAPSLDRSSNSVLAVAVLTTSGTAEGGDADNPRDFLSFSATSHLFPVLDVQRRLRRRQRAGLPVERDLHPGRTTARRSRTRC